VSYTSGTECTANTVPTISSVTPTAASQGETLTVTGSWVVFADSTAYCYFWSTANGATLIDNSVATIIDPTSMTCAVPMALTGGTTFYLTVYVYRTSGSNHQLNQCYSHLGQSYASCTSGMYSTLSYSSAECTANTIPTITSVSPASASSGDSLTITGFFTIFGDTVATCLFWVNDTASGGTTATSVTASQIHCPVLNLNLGSSATVKVTVQVYRSSASIPNLDYCYSSLGQAPEQWTAEKYGSFLYSGSSNDCTSNTVPVISSLVPEVAKPGETLNITGVYSVFGDTVAVCMFWVDDVSQGGSDATDVTSTEIQCPVKELTIDGQQKLVKVTVQVYRESAATPNLDFCYSHEGEAPAQWTTGQFATFTYDAGVNGSTRNAISVFLVVSLFLFSFLMEM